MARQGEPYGRPRRVEPFTWSMAALVLTLYFFHDGRRIRGPDQAKGPEGYQLVSPRVNPEGFKIRGPPLAPRFLLRVSPEGYHLLVLRRRIAVVNPLQ